MSHVKLSHGARKVTPELTETESTNETITFSELETRLRLTSLREYKFN